MHDPSCHYAHIFVSFNYANMLERKTYYLLPKLKTNVLYCHIMCFCARIREKIDFYCGYETKESNDYIDSIKSTPTRIMKISELGKSKKIVSLTNQSIVSLNSELFCLY